MATKTKKTKKKTLNKRTYVAVVIDRSGSMSGLKQATVDSINEQLGVFRRESKNHEIVVTLVQFDDQIDVLTDAKDPNSIDNWTLMNFEPRGSTAMYDAVWASINNLQKQPVVDDTAYLVCVISDGYENASREVSQIQLANKIKELQDTGKWTFTYMLANQDIRTVSNNLSVPVSNVASFTANTIGLRSATNAMTGSYSSYFVSRGGGQTQTTAFYNDPLDNTTLTNTKP